MKLGRWRKANLRWKKRIARMARHERMLDKRFAGAHDQWSRTARQLLQLEVMFTVPAERNTL